MRWLRTRKGVEGRSKDARFHLQIEANAICQNIMCIELVLIDTALFHILSHGDYEIG
jgi:hypothetical protein